MSIVKNGSPVSSNLKKVPQKHSYLSWYKYYPISKFNITICTKGQCHLFFNKEVYVFTQNFGSS